MVESLMINYHLELFKVNILGESCKKNQILVVERITENIDE